MAIKFGMSVADMILQLTKGFMKATGRKPEALEKIKIQQEAAQRFRDQRKVVDMEGNVIDTSKGIMGGTQIGQRGMFDNIFNRMQRDMGKGKPKEVKNKKPDPEKKADGGIMRVGYKLGSIDKARRAFLKTAAGVGAGIGALKTGLLGLSKQAGPAVETVKETVAQAPSYFFDLVAKIKMLGKPGISIGPRQNTMNYKNYELMEDVSTGDIRITKQKGDPDFGYEEEVMEYRKGQRTEDGVIPDEYEEATIRPDGDGKMKDFEDGIEPDSIQEIIKEVSDQAPSIKKAGGGIARMLGE